MKIEESNKMEKGHEGYFNDLEGHCMQCLVKNKEIAHWKADAIAYYNEIRYCFREIIRLKAEVTRLKAESWDNREDRGKPYKYINGK